jgi:predicted TIM-barrel fold metal-dependent hydrolase
MGERDPVGLLDRCAAIPDNERDKIAGLNAAKLFGLKVPNKVSG